MSGTTKTVAERLREINMEDACCRGELLAFAFGEGTECINCKSCGECVMIMAHKLADAIEAEQAKPQLPEGIEWPRFTDGELVKFGDEFVSWDGETHKVRSVEIYSPEADPDYAVNPGNVHNFVGGKKGSHGEFVKRPEPEVLDADGVPIKVGDTVYHKNGSARNGERMVKSIEAEPGHIRKVFFKENGCWANPRDLTHRKPDTFKSVVTEMLTDFDSHDTIELDGYFDRLRKLMGGE